MTFEIKFFHLLLVGAVLDLDPNCMDSCVNDRVVTFRLQQRFLFVGVGNGRPTTVIEYRGIRPSKRTNTTATPSNTVRGLKEVFPLIS